MATGKRTAKRNRSEASTSQEQTPKKRGGLRTENAPPPPQPSSPSPPPERENPSGHPFIQQEVEWNYDRPDMLGLPHKVIVGGYESMSGDVMFGTNVWHVIKTQMFVIKTQMFGM